MKCPFLGRREINRGGEKLSNEELHIAFFAKNYYGGD
jgi:hypothetical protein